MNAAVTSATYCTPTHSKEALWSSYVTLQQRNRTDDDGTTTYRFGCKTTRVDRSSSNGPHERLQTFSRRRSLHAAQSS